MAEGPGKREELTSDTRSRTLPLNSRRLTSSIVTRIEKALELPSTGTLEDTKQIVEGKLTEMGLEPKHMLIVVHVTEGGGAPKIELKNAEGVFQTIEVEVSAEGDEEELERDWESASEENVSQNGSEMDESQVLDKLKQEFESAHEENAGLKIDVGQLNEKVKREKDKYKDLWRLNCEQLREYDDAIAEKEEEIERLRRQVAVLELGSGMGLRRVETRVDHSSSTTFSAVAGEAPPVVCIELAHD